MDLIKFLKSKLTDCAEYILQPEDKNYLSKKGLEEFIIWKLLSKKFRKYSIDEKTREHIKISIRLNIKNRQPIQFIFPFGGYKMWCLPSFPYPDWAELFSISYYCSYIAFITKVYKPGAKLYFFPMII